jgi:hypothetical protein
MRLKEKRVSFDERLTVVAASLAPLFLSQLRPREVKQMFWALLDASAVDTATIKRGFPLAMQYMTDKGKVSTRADCR